MISFNPKELKVPEVHRLLIGGIGPRPIALVSTLSESGIPNLSPFSFFNCFGANPPIVAFSPARRGRDGTFKDTYKNLIATQECTIQAVTYSMVGQISVASTEYPENVDEFIKSGLTPIKSDIVKPFRVKESPFQMECKLNQMINLGEGNASGNLAICEVLKFHVDESIMTNGIIDPHKIDLIARMGGQWYCRAFGDALFEWEQPTINLGVGYDSLPSSMKNSEIFSANDLGKFATITSIPNHSSINEFFKLLLSEDSVNTISNYLEIENYEEILRQLKLIMTNKTSDTKFKLHEIAKYFLKENKIEIAWKIFLLENYLNG